MSATLVGRRLRRKEDTRLVTGVGRYVADLKLDGTADVAFLRSPFAHAEIKAIDASRARASSGVVTILTARDIAGRVGAFTRFVDQEHTPPRLEESIRPIVRPCPMEVLASERVRYVGQPVAAVVAANRYLAEDALDAIDVDYQPLEVVANPVQARQPDAPAIHEHVEDNLQAQFEVVLGDVDGAFREADTTVALEIRSPRVSANPLETRGVLATYDPGRGDLTVWLSTQVPFMVRTRVAEMLQLAEDRVRVIAPEVGGGFGPKANVYSEDVIVAFAAIRLQRPVRWVEDRREHLLSTAHSRDQLHEIKVACREDGRITALRDRFVVDCGAYNPFSLTCAYNTGAHLRGLHAIENYEVRGECVLTNKMPNVPYRGAGRPEAVFAIDRVLDELASKLELDPAELRRTNLIPPEAMPYDQGMLYRDGSPIVYDRGDYRAALDQALELVEYRAVRERQKAIPSEGRRLGVGLSTYVEGTGIGPFEGARVRVDQSGHVLASVGSCAHGQSHETTLGQICADALGVSLEDVSVRTGDTALVPYGVGTFASRSIVTAGTALLQAAQTVRTKILAVAAELLEVGPDDLVVQDGKVLTRGAPARSVTLRDVARAAAPGPRCKVPTGLAPGLEATEYFSPAAVTFAYGVHAAVVEVDPELGQVDVQRYVVVHDAGRLINPTVVEGQIDGGVVQGLGCALYEEVVHDEAGQVLTTSFMDYLLPTAVESPRIQQAHLETLADGNPLGVRGVGEGGAISPPAAVANAVADAFRAEEIDLRSLPLTPEKVWTAIRESAKRRGALA